MTTGEGAYAEGVVYTEDATEISGHDAEGNMRWRLDAEGVWQVRLDGKQRRLAPRRQRFYRKMKEKTRDE